MRSFLVLIHYSLTFSIFVIKEEAQNVDNISGSSEVSASGSGDLGSGSLESVTSETRYPTELVVRDSLSKCEYGYTGKSRVPRIPESAFFQKWIIGAWILMNVPAEPTTAQKNLYVWILKDLTHAYVLL